MRTVPKTLLGLALFSTAMGYLESAVVIYLRQLYYPSGFSFPLTPIPPHVAVVEFFREIATLIMLAGIGWFAGKNRPQRFAYFLFCFGIWDISYYVFLKLLLGWPASVFTWDILFLVPLPWVGPVLAPCIVSLTMILYTLALSWLHHHEPGIGLWRKERIAVWIGSLILIISFLWDYLRYLVNHWSAGIVWRPGSDQALFRGLGSFKPDWFNWGIFWIGELLLAWVIIRLLTRIYRIRRIQGPENPGKSHGSGR
ncbi:MAG TPA: hypothetical protein VMV20_04415 [Chitinophagaceae bacterium]|nr:hypothetical protein [Chitinophagaceae bacterium]